jgi:DNA repair protein RadC
VSPDPEAGYADHVAYAAKPLAAPLPARQNPARSRTWKLQQFPLYAGYEGLLVRTVLLRSPEFKASLKSPPVDTPEKVYELVKHLGEHDHEYVVVLCLDAAMRVTTIYEAAIGGRSGVQVEVSNIIKVPVLAGAGKVILVHNHPSGDPVPSRQDVEFTERAKRALDCIGIDLVDHIVISSEGRWMSMFAELPHVFSVGLAAR